MLLVVFIPLVSVLPSVVIPAAPSRCMNSSHAMPEWHRTSFTTLCTRHPHSYIDRHRAFPSYSHVRSNTRFVPLHSSHSPSQPKHTVASLAHCSLKSLRRKLDIQLPNRIPTMPQHNLRMRPLLQPPDHLMTPNPRIVISCQPPLRYAVRIILLDMILIARKDPRPTLFQIHLHDGQSRGVSRRMM